MRPTAYALFAYDYALRVCTAGCRCAYATCRDFHQSGRVLKEHRMNQAVTMTGSGQAEQMRAGHGARAA